MRNRGSTVSKQALCNPGQVLKVRLQTYTPFQLPISNLAPIVLIGAGTGIAPFRGFWQHRMALLKSGVELGEAIIVFGCRDRSESETADARKPLHRTTSDAEPKGSRSAEPVELPYAEPERRAAAPGRFSLV